MKNIEYFLKTKKVRPTAMRILVMRLLAGKNKAMTLTDIESFFERSDRTTLFRTMKTFEEKGIVHRINDGGGVPKYALCEEGCAHGMHRDLHLHFHCVECKETSCLTDHKIPPINLPEGYLAQDVNYIINGRCARCNAG